MCRALAALEITPELVTFTLEELAARSGGELLGDPAQVITGAASLPEATAGEISFFANPKYMPLLRKTGASAVFVPAVFNEEISAAQIRVANPAKAFEQVVRSLAPAPVRFAPGVHPTAVVSPEATLGARVSIQPHAVIEAGATIGDDTVVGANCYVGHGTHIGQGCVIYPQVTLRERTMVGDRVIIHSNATIGADGFGFELVDGRHQKIPQIGIVQIDDDVEIGANTTIDRARFGRTWIKEGAKIDNLVQIAHNVVVGRHSVIAAQTGIAGSSRVGDYVMVGGNVGVTDHVEIGDRNIIGARTGVSKDLPPNGGTWWGTVAVPAREAKQQLAWVHRLGQLFARVKAIEKKLGL